MFPKRLNELDAPNTPGAALKDLGMPDNRETGRGLNNRAENSHQPFRRREHAMLRFRRMGSLQKFVAVHSSIHNHFNLERGLKQNGFGKAEAGSFSSVSTRRGECGLQRLA